ncbi:MAG: family 20 glycosylhydrolase [Planctomycetes bacterium]|nr:family 20 glycosylhydrolase [Planctomycetota bacterium]
MAKPLTLYWQTGGTPQKIQSILRTMGEEYPIRQGEGKGGLAVEFAAGGPAGGLEITVQSGRAVVRYDRPHHAIRGVGTLLSGLARPGRKISEGLPFETFGIMLDCSRNAVMTVEHLERWLRRLALLGYNMAMLYTEDTYELPGESYFGYMRGRYTAAELRRLDEYAGRLGIEMIGCIQTLGHLQQILKWPAYGKIKDTGSVMMVDEPATYELIEKMLRNFAECFRSRRIHIGMDETHDLGRGRFMDVHGCQRGYDLFNRHLAKVVEICGRVGLKPMIWSDMFFRMGNKTQDYYDLQTRIPDDVKNAIPKQVSLVYWDYYHEEENFYLAYIDKHRELGFEPVMASGVWTWGIPWYGRHKTQKTIVPCIKACRDKKVREFMFTLWGDDGGYCEFDSALAGLTLGAELAYAGQAAPGSVEKRFAAICGGDYGAVELACELNGGKWSASGVLWDDPILGIYWNNVRSKDKAFWPASIKSLKALQKKLAKWKGVKEPVDMAHAYALVSYMAGKLTFRADLDAAWAKRDRAKLAAVARGAAGMAKTAEATLGSFRRQWYRRNKPNGFDTIQIRLGGQVQRYKELAQRLNEFRSGAIETIPELDEALPRTDAWVHTGWGSLAVSGVIAH